MHVIVEWSGRVIEHHFPERIVYLTLQYPDDTLVRYIYDELPVFGPAKRTVERACYALESGLRRLHTRRTLDAQKHSHM